MQVSHLDIFQAGSAGLEGDALVPIINCFYIYILMCSPSNFPCPNSPVVLDMKLLGWTSIQEFLRKS